MKGSIYGTYNINMFTFVIYGLSAVFLALFLFRKWLTSRKHKIHTELGCNLSIGFFHPYCNAGGGGECVLWYAVKCVQERYPQFKCVVYTGDNNASPSEILSRAEHNLNIKIKADSVKFVYLYQRRWVEANMYPHFTLLGQSLGSLILGIEALIRFPPTIYIDTMGYAFTLPLFRFLGGCSVGCYVHYPTISTDMLQKVVESRPSHNNAVLVSRSRTLTAIKLYYYKIFAFLYSLMGRCSEVIMVNSTWTKNHVVELWKQPDRTYLVYPPCDVSEFSMIDIKEPSRAGLFQTIVSIGQFRPEKDHPLQIRAFQRLLEIVQEKERDSLRLILIGSCRHADDERRVEELRRLCLDLGVKDQVCFELNIPFAVLKQHLAEATIGLHTMWNEHFGIGIVQTMAAGVLVLAHNSGGPKLDIVTDYEGGATGLLASDVESYASQMSAILNMEPEDRIRIRQNARKSVMRFSIEEFNEKFADSILPLLNPHIHR